MAKIINVITVCMVFFMVSVTSYSLKPIIKKNIDLSQTQEPRLQQPESDAPRITVWIHGTKALGVVSDFVHATAKPGLAHISTLPAAPLPKLPFIQYHLRALTNTLAQQDPQQFPLEHFYVFGWSGQLSFQAREQDARNLRAALELLIQEYVDKYEVKPYITIITHSHGGGVALNMARETNHTSTLKIDRLILLACPVQDDTKDFIKDPLFGTVYAFYSKLDLIQIGDPQGWYKKDGKRRSTKIFSEHAFPIYPNLKQVHIKIPQLWFLWNPHLGFILNHFARILPAIIKQTDCWEMEAPSMDKQERELTIKA